MSHNSFGHLFRVTTFGESHGPALGCVVDGCPPLIPLEAGDIQAELDKRRPGQSRFTTQRREPDEVKILSGRLHRRAPGQAGHDRHADRAADRERRPALEGLFRHPRQVPPRPRRLHLRRQIRHPRLSRRRALVGARDRGAGRRRRDRPQGARRRHHPRRARADGTARDRPRQLGLGRGRPATRSSAPTPRPPRSTKTTSTSCARPAPRSAPSSRSSPRACRRVSARRSTASSTPTSRRR